MGIYSLAKVEAETEIKPAFMTSNP
jgi:hypothetical protein